MANVIPFRGVLYDPAVVSDVAKVVAPPYDIIDAEYQQALHARHPNNIIRLELGLDQPTDGPSDNRYTRAADLLRQWVQSGALRRDAEPAVYVYTIEYRAPSDTGKIATKVLKGFLSRVELEEFGTGRIFPHENTRSAAKADRLELLKACRSNFSPIFSLFSDPDGSVMRLLEKSLDTEKPRIDFQDDAGFRQRLWAITDRAVLDEINRAMKPKPLFIADGHHRYETALAYRRMKREEGGRPPNGPVGTLRPYDQVLMLFASLEDPGLTVLPTHRVLTTPVPPIHDITQQLRDAFEIEEVPFEASSEGEARMRFLTSLRRNGESGPAFGLILRGLNRYLLLALRASHRPTQDVSERDRLDVSILQARVIPVLCPSATDQEAIVYTKDDDEAIDLVRKNTAQASLLLNPTKVSEVRAVASSGGRMPHKSTYFFPKPLTGLVINVLEE
ncbi:MAG TPA: DUF1015 domain-containing protein [Nitrospiraceae bacterium]|nr:DUF1015 domain-containing protein [Nitrospiraceae bacterium]